MGAIRDFSVQLSSPALRDVDHQADLWTSNGVDGNG